MKRFLILFLSFIITISNAQQGWDWGVDKQKSQEKWFRVVENVNQKNYAATRGDIHWLLVNTPHLNVDLYKQAAKIYQALEKSILEPKEKKQFQDSVLWVYDTRISEFGDSANVLNRKGLYAYRYKAQDPKAYSELFDLYSKLYDLNGYNTYLQNTLYYMAVASNRVKSKVLKESAFISLYNTISDYSKTHIAKENSEKLRLSYVKNQTQIDGIFSSSITMTCEKIEELYGDKLIGDSIDLSVAKNIYQLLVGAECTSSEMYHKALKTVNEVEPSTNGYLSLAEYFHDKKDYKEEDAMYNKALELTTSDSQKGEVYFLLAQKAKRKKQLVKARDYALQTIKTGVNVKESYVLIGDLYMYNSSSTCKNSDEVINRSKYLAAYDMYEKAGDSKKMAAAAEQFPSEQEIFFKNRKVGDVINTGCWINKSVVLRKR